MQTGENLLVVMNKKFSSLSRGQKRIASYLNENFEQAAFQTAAEIGKETGVSESTVIRFAFALGYESFADFHKALEQLIKKRLDNVKKIELSRQYSDQSELLRLVLQSDIAKLEDTLTELDLSAMSVAVENILQARTVYIMGIRDCLPLAQSLYFYLQKICPSLVLLHSTNSSDIFEQMIRICEEDVMIGISFPRYSMRTIKAMEFASSRSAKIITLTDSVYSPINMYSSCNLLAKSDLSSVLDSLVAPMSVINALVMALYMERQEEVVRHMELMEQLREDYQISSKDEINFFDPQKGTGLHE